MAFMAAEGTSVAERDGSHDLEGPAGRALDVVEHAVGADGRKAQHRRQHRPLHRPRQHEGGAADERFPARALAAQPSADLADALEGDGGARSAVDDDDKRLAAIEEGAGGGEERAELGSPRSA
jgi:hypothetical protein